MLKFIENQEEVLANVECSSLDAAVISDFKESIQAAPAAQGRKFFVDLSKVEFIDSSGVGALLSLFKKSQAGESEFIFLNPHPTTQSVLELLKLHRVFVIEHQP